MRPYNVDVPVRIMIWTRPECQRKQFEIIREAAPSILFLVSDGGRNEKENELIKESRSVFDAIDWECEIHKIYFDENQGLYTIFKSWSEYIWSRVDRCIFLEDDYLPSVSFFEYCAQLLEKYKDDERIEMITGNNVLGEYHAAEPYDYFFTENGWSIWGTATWRRVVEDYKYPLGYENNEYIDKCLKRNLSKFWYKKARGYCQGKLVDNHIPATEYFHAANSALYHRMSIVPTKNMIQNIGIYGEHVNYQGIEKHIPSYLKIKKYEMDFPIKHPKYVIDDKSFGDEYEICVEHRITRDNFLRITRKRIRQVILYAKKGELLSKIKCKLGVASQKER